MVLLLPTFFYLSKQQQPYNIAKDFALMQTQKSQGNGPPPAIEPALAQAWKWKKPWEGWTATGADKLSLDYLKGNSDKEAAIKGAIMPKMENATAK
jgi:hypothetical protein